MLDDLRGLAVFVTVVQAGSFSAAARRLKIAPSVVSHHISRLETSFGVPLFFRSTRALSLTSEGQRIVGSAQAMVDAAEEVVNLLSDLVQKPVGDLSVSLPSFGDNSPVQSAIWAFAARHQKVSLQVCGMHHPDEPAEAKHDLTINLNAQSNDADITKRIGDFDVVLVASPSYLRDNGPIQDIEALKSGHYVFSDVIPKKFTLANGKNVVEITPEKSRVSVCDLAAGKTAVLSGLGILRLARPDVEAELSDGRLIQILPDWTLPKVSVYAHWSASSGQKQLIQMLVDEVSKDLAEKVPETA